jgi:ketosteroid isomerase-like protein
VARGHAAIRQALSRLVAMRPKLRLEVIKVVAGAGDLAVVYNDWAMSATDPDGTTRERTGKAIEVMRRQADGSWRVVIDDPYARG